MRRTVDPVDLIRDHNPVPGAHLLPDGPESASTEALFEEIIGMNQTNTTRTRRPRKRILLLAAAIAALSAVAAATIALGDGMLDKPIFTGEAAPTDREAAPTDGESATMDEAAAIDEAITNNGATAEGFGETTWDGKTWALRVGEAANDELGTVFKVCHTFGPLEGATDGNGYGTSGCEVVSIYDATDTIFVEIAPAIDTAAGPVLFVDMSITPVATVSALLDDGSTIDVVPFRMPLSGKQFAAVEIPIDATDTVAIRALDETGNVTESQIVTDLTMTPPPNQ